MQPVEKKGFFRNPFKKPTNEVNQVNVANEANFLANNNGGLNKIGKVVGAHTSTLNFGSDDSAPQRLGGKGPTNHINELETHGKVNFVGGGTQKGAMNKIDKVVSMPGSRVVFSQL